MKAFKGILHIWITLVSIVGFLFGWMILAHSKKPVQTTTASLTTTNVSVQALPTLAPIDPFGGSSSSANSGGGFQVFSPSIQAQPQAMMPVFTTRGS